MMTTPMQRLFIASLISARRLLKSKKVSPRGVMSRKTIRAMGHIELTKLTTFVSPAMTAHGGSSAKLLVPNITKTVAGFIADQSLEPSRRR
jgi:hypothetical protein